ncbi:cytochrome C oxidase subunit IV family protein [Paenibacillus sp.]|uniref:cytochrome C oxidase subunit IV family protein n=1 Tax=Paenibacillus sp. TaxID=58172 RepID=UPI002D753913|nr:cytochrome C oxidase subunit IV family protein [Paenibacillus sp.]HZG55759.1 cytochrome C oxidase subunit IV family protein [Paenibacillus sp.]
MADHTLNNESGNGTTVRRKHRHEGPKNHLLAFVLSILLTAFAFLAVAYALVYEKTHVEPWFVYFFIIGLAIFQAVVQLAYWMHMKDRGHGWPIFGIAFGFFVALTCAAAGLLWSWW